MSEGKNLPELAKFYNKIEEPTNENCVTWNSALVFCEKDCIKCDGCVRKCSLVSVHCLQSKKEENRELDNTKKEQQDCITCGQCTTVCPTGALREKSHILEVEKALQDNTKTVILQIAPSIRVSLGSFFGLPFEEDTQGRLSTACRQLGFDFIFDAGLGADLTTLTEAQELLHNLSKDDFPPLFTSCCPAWVNFVQQYYPHMKTYLSTTRSPHIQSAGVYKTWFAKQRNLDPKNIVVVSAMPCVAKKQEADRSTFSSGEKMVDYVLTTRELAVLLRKHIGDISLFAENEMDSLTQNAESGVIYGLSGGVALSALKTAYFLATKQEIDPSVLQFQLVSNGIKKLSLSFLGKTISVAVVSGIKNVESVLKELEQNPQAYQYVEVMACEGGCIGGGGQPIFGTPDLVEKRAKTIGEIAQKGISRLAHQNDIANQILTELGENSEVLFVHTHK